MLDSWQTWFIVRFVTSCNRRILCGAVTPRLRREVAVIHTYDAGQTTPGRRALRERAMRRNVLARTSAAVVAAVLAATALPARASDDDLSTNARLLASVRNEDAAGID